MMPILDIISSDSTKVVSSDSYKDEYMIYSCQKDNQNLQKPTGIT